MSLIDLLNRHNPRIEWQEETEHQACRRVGNVTQHILRVGMSWSWLITSDNDGTVLDGKVSWNATPEDAARAADDAMEAANLRFVDDGWECPQCHGPAVEARMSGLCPSCHRARADRF